MNYNCSILVRVIPLGVDFVYVTIELAQYAQGASSEITVMINFEGAFSVVVFYHPYIIIEEI